jgi:hypothetical protein
MAIIQKDSWEKEKGKRMKASKEGRREGRE